MTPEQNPALQPENNPDGNNETAPVRDNKTLSGGQIPEIATNDGSVTETLDTVFHGKPGWVEGENPSGSNRADYYEARSQGKTDAEEELDARKGEKPQ